MTAHRLATRANLRRIVPAIFSSMRALFALLTAAILIAAGPAVGASSGCTIAPA
jgi:hypothetical protein